jgi:hemerythrin superfamily protein
MNAIQLLKDDHNRVSALFEKFKADEDGDHSELFKEVKMELDTHTHIEETIFYPKLQEEGDEELKDIVMEGIEEHRQAKMFLRELDALADDSEKFKPKFQVLMEDVEHHVQEEEGEMFKMVQEQFDEATLDELGAEMEEEKQNFQSKSASASGR